MWINNLRPRVRKRLRVLVVTVLVAAGLMAVQPYLWRKAAAMATMVQRSRSQIKQAADVKERAEKLAEGIKREKGSLERLAVVVPQDRDTIQVLERVESVAQRTGLEIDVVNIREGHDLKDQEGHSVPIFPLTISVSASARPSMLLRYLEAMEHIQGLVQIDSLLIRPGEGQNFNLDMSIVFYLQKNEQR